MWIVCLTRKSSNGFAGSIGRCIRRWTSGCGGSGRPFVGRGRADAKSPAQLANVGVRSVGQENQLQAMCHRGTLHPWHAALLARGCGAMIMRPRCARSVHPKTPGVYRFSPPAGQGANSCASHPCTRANRASPQTAPCRTGRIRTVSPCRRADPLNSALLGQRGGPKRGLSRLGTPTQVGPKARLGSLISSAKVKKSHGKWGGAFSDTSF